jgi:hypothetical protein
MPKYQPLRCHKLCSVRPEIFQYKYFVRLYKKHNIICQRPTYKKDQLRLNLWHMFATTPHKFMCQVLTLKKKITIKYSLPVLYVYGNTTEQRQQLNIILLKAKLQKKIIRQIIKQR